MVSERMVERVKTALGAIYAQEGKSATGAGVARQAGVDAMSARNALKELERRGEVTSTAGACNTVYWTPAGEEVVIRQGAVRRSAHTERIVQALRAEPMGTAQAAALFGCSTTAALHRLSRAWETVEEIRRIRRGHAVVYYMEGDDRAEAVLDRVHAKQVAARAAGGRKARRSVRKVQVAAPAVSPALKAAPGLLGVMARSAKTRTSREWAVMAGLSPEACWGQLADLEARGEVERRGGAWACVGAPPEVERVHHGPGWGPSRPYVEVPVRFAADGTRWLQHNGKEYRGADGVRAALMWECSHAVAVMGGVE